MRLSATERRQAIIQSAIRLFSEKGFRGTTTRELAADVGVSEPVIYQHFATKKDLYAAIIESKSREVSDEMDCCRDDGKSDDRAAFLTLARMIWRWHEDDRTLMRLLFFSALEGNELADMFFTRHATGFLKAVTGYVQSRIQAGAFRPMDPETLAWSFIGMVAHHAQSVSVFHFDPAPRPREEVLEDTVDLFLRGILKDQGRDDVAKGTQQVKTDKQPLAGGRARRNGARVDAGRGGSRLRKKA
jgi:AcrR family transcriptional regulator